MVSSSARVPAVAVPFFAPVAPRDVIVCQSEDNSDASAGSGPFAGFDRQDRLLTPAHYAGVFSARKVVRGTAFALHYCGNDVSHARLGLIVPKKQAKQAVLRNAIKRQAREVFRLRRSCLPAYDLVLRLVQPVRRSGILVDKQRKGAWRTEINVLFDRLPA